MDVTDGFVLTSSGITPAKVFRSEEEMIHEARRKRQRIGKSPPYPREVTIPLTSTNNDQLWKSFRSNKSNNNDSRNSSSNSRRYPMASTPIPGRPQQNPQTFFDDSPAKRVTFFDAQSTALASSSKINPNDESAIRAALNEALNELTSAVKKIQTLSKKLEGLTGVSSNVDDKLSEIMKETQRSAEKRKRSRQVIHVRRTFDTMEIDVDGTPDS